jgi:hypothetical protein
MRLTRASIDRKIETLNVRSADAKVRARRGIGVIGIVATTLAGVWWWRRRAVRG